MSSCRTRELTVKTIGIGAGIFIYIFSTISSITDPMFMKSNDFEFQMKSKEVNTTEKSR